MPTPAAGSDDSHHNDSAAAIASNSGNISGKLAFKNLATLALSRSFLMDSRAQVRFSMFSPYDSPFL